MVKEKRILSYVLGWLIVGFIIIFIGFNNVYAASYTGFDFTAQLYDNLGPTLNAVTTSGPAAGTGHYEGYIGYTAYSSGGAWGISSPITLIANHTYTLTANVLNECGYPILSTYNRIGVGDTLNNAKISYQNNTNVNEVYSKAIGGSNFLIQYAFTPTINATYIVFPFATSVSCSSSRTLLEGITIEDLGIDGVTQDQINTSLNNQTNELNNSIQNSTNTITGEIDDMEQNIIDSNKETQDVIKDQFNTCRASLNLFDKNNANVLEGYIDSNNIVSNSNYKTYYISILPNTTYTISRTGVSSIYVAEKSTIPYLGSSITNRINGSNKYITYTTSSTANYLLFQVYRNGYDNLDEVLNTLQVEKGNIATEYEPYGEEICSNKIDDTNDKLDGIQGALTDSSAPNTSGLENSAGWLPAGPLDSVLNLPLSLFNALTTNLNKSCNPINIPLPYVNKNITLPCINTLYNQIGITSFLSWIGVIVSGLMLYTYLLKLYKWIEDRISLNETHNVDSWGGL